MLQVEFNDAFRIFAQPPKKVQVKYLFFHSALRNFMYKFVIIINQPYLSIHKGTLMCEMGALVEVTALFLVVGP